MDKLPKLGIVGCGAIGGEVARFIDRGELDFDLTALCDIDSSQTAALIQSLSQCKPRSSNLDELVRDCDVIFEAAQASAVRDILLALSQSLVDFGNSEESYTLCVEHAKSCVVMSVGGIAYLSTDDLDTINRSGLRVYIPSGAVGGIDALHAMRESGLESVSLTTRKPPKALGRDDAVETVVFEGSAEDALQSFPKNINVAMTIRLAIGNDIPFVVRIVSDPLLTVNTHTIEAVSRAGKARMMFENEPHPDMPRTSYLAPMSAVAILRKIGKSFIIGT